MIDELREKIGELLIWIEEPGMSRKISTLLKLQPETMDDIMQLIAAHDKTLKQKLLAGLPEKKVPPYGKPHDRAEEEALSNAAIGYNQALSDVTKLITEVYGE